MSTFDPGIRLRWTASRRKRAPAISTQQWNRHREEISRLHSSMKLDDLMIHMKTQHEFSPSKHQFVLQLQKWGCRKYKSKDGTTSATTSSPASNAAVAQADAYKFVDNAALGQADHFDNSYDEWENLNDPIPDLAMPGQQGITHTPRSGMTPDTDLTTSNAPTQKHHVQAIEEEVEEVLRGFSSPEGLNNNYLNDLSTSQLHRISTMSTTSPPASIMSVTSSRSGMLQRVPRAQKRPRSIASTESMPAAPKRNRPFGEGSPSHVTTSSPFEVVLATSSSDTDALPAGSPPQVPAVENGMQPTTVSHLATTTTSSSNGSLRSKTPRRFHSTLLRTITLSERASGVIGAGNLSRESALKRLFRLAQEGQVLCPDDYVHKDKIQKIAWFFFGAGLYEESFVLQLLIFKSIQTAPESTDDVLFPLVIDLTRCSRNDSQNHIVKDLLLKTSRRRHWGRWGDPMENFLLHSFLTLVYRRQDNHSKADHHCHRAIQFFQMSQHLQKASSPRWLSLSIVAWTHLRSSVTEKRLQVKGNRLTNSVRRRVCTRASDQLVMSFRTSQRLGQMPMVADQPQLDTKSIALRTLFEWCLQSLVNRPAQFDERQPWKKFRAEGMKLRDLGMTTLYCELWKAWHQETAESSLFYTISHYWSSTIEDELGINPSECLATMPETIAIEWPVLDEDISIFANWRTYRQELYQRAAANLKQLLEFSDAKLAHHFFEAYSSHCIAFSRPTFEQSASLHRECVVSFVDDNLDLMLPALSLQEHVNESNRQSMMEVPLELAEGPVSQPVEPDLPAEAVVEPPMVDPPMSREANRNSTMSYGTMSTDLASMKSIQRRAAQRRISRQISDADSKLPSRAMEDYDSMSIDGIIGLTRRSFQSFSLHEDDEQSVEKRSSTTLLKGSLSQTNVMVH